MALFEPLALGAFRLPNRVVMALLRCARGAPASRAAKPLADSVS